MALYGIAITVGVSLHIPATQKECDAMAERITEVIEEEFKPDGVVVMAQRVRQEDEDGA